jgi:hypothetical protein
VRRAREELRLPTAHIEAVWGLAIVSSGVWLTLSNDPQNPR